MTPPSWMVYAALAFVLCNGNPIAEYELDRSIMLFRSYIQIETITNQSDFQNAVDFWSYCAEALQVPMYVYEYTENHPVVVIKFAGSDSSLPSIMLNSHMDIVTYDESEWTHHPLSGDLDEEGVIWGRGTQDMKSVSIQYYEALRRIQLNNITLLRDVYMTLMPDEEMGGQNGMVKFLQSQEFKDMNVGFELDEGGGFPTDYYLMLHHDKAVWQIQVDCRGSTAHGGTFPARNVSAIGQCITFMELMYSFRDEQYEIAANTPFFESEVFTSVNINQIHGGTANNIIPNHVTMMFDMRLAYTVNLTEFEEMLESFATRSGNSVTITYLVKDEHSPGTVLNSTNPYYAAITEASQELNITLTPIVPPGSTDGRYVRNMGIPAFGYSPMANTQTLPHLANERINATTFLKGIDIYEEMITRLGNIPADETASDSSMFLIGTPRGVDFS